MIKDATPPPHYVQSVYQDVIVCVTHHIIW